MTNSRISQFDVVTVQAYAKLTTAMIQKKFSQVAFMGTEYSLIYTVSDVCKSAANGTFLRVEIYAVEHTHPQVTHSVKNKAAVILP